MKKVTAWKALCISVNCKKNDAVDIKCGGPPFLGFDFYIDPSKKEEMTEFIQECLKENNRPCLSIHASTTALVKNVWTKEMIKKCIKNGY